MKADHAAPRGWYEFEHMVWDIDGTLLNSNIAHVWAWQDAIEAENLFLPYLTLLMQMGLPGKHIVEKFGFALRDQQTAQKIGKAASEIYASRYVNLVAPHAGMYRLLSALQRRGSRLHALTSAAPLEAERMLKRFRLNRFFDKVLAGEDTDEGKPSAEPFLKLKEMLGARSDMISFGDSPYDFKASSAAGVPFVYIGHGGFPREWFTKAYATFFNVNEMLESLRARTGKTRARRAA